MRRNGAERRWIRRPAAERRTVIGTDRREVVRHAARSVRAGPNDSGSRRRVWHVFDRAPFGWVTATGDGLVSLDAHGAAAGVSSIRFRVAGDMSRRARLDDEFEAFFLAEFESIAQSVATVCGDRERAVDATQEAFIKAYARWGTIRQYDRPGAWIRRIAINATRDMHRAETRRARRERRTTERDVVAAGEPPVPGSALELLDGLPDRQREVAALYYLDDLPAVEIGQILGISEGTVRFHLSEARTRLRDALGPSWDGGHVAR